MDLGSDYLGLAVFLQQFINGLTLGSIYGLIAVGYTMVFGIIGMVNFAHGDVFMVSCFIVLILFMLAMSVLGGASGAVLIALLISLMLGMALTGLWSWAIERLAYRPLRGSFRLAPLISTIGVSIFLVNFVQVAQGARNKAIPPLFSGGIPLMEADGFTVMLSYKQIMIVLVMVSVLFLFWHLVKNTSFGRAQRACEMDIKMAAILGVNVDRTISLTFVIGAALASVASLMYLILYGVISFTDGFIPGIKAFSAAVLGGIGSIPGAIIGGLLIGAVETLWGAYISSDYKDVASFALLIITLIFLPQGFLGKPEVQKV